VADLEITEGPWLVSIQFQLLQTGVLAAGIKPGTFGLLGAQGDAILGAWVFAAGEDNPRRSLLANNGAARVTAAQGVANGKLTATISNARLVEVNAEGVPIDGCRISVPTFNVDVTLQDESTPPR
jgi:hypothetical protein